MMENARFKGNNIFIPKTIDLIFSGAPTELFNTIGPTAAQHRNLPTLSHRLTEATGSNGRPTRIS